MATIHRPPVVTRYNPRDATAAVNSHCWQNELNLILKGQDKFFTAGGPEYDYPNPRGPIQNYDLKTWVNTSLRLLGKDKFFTSGGPEYDYQNPRAPGRSVDLLTWIQGFDPNINVPSRTFVYDYPNPRGAPHFVKDWVQGFHPRMLPPVPTYDWPVPKGRIPSVDLRTWINEGALEVEITYPHSQYDWPNPS